MLFMIQSVVGPAWQAPLNDVRGVQLFPAQDRALLTMASNFILGHQPCAPFVGDHRVAGCGGRSPVVKDQADRKVPAPEITPAMQ